MTIEEVVWCPQILSGEDATRYLTTSAELAIDIYTSITKQNQKLQERILKLIYDFYECTDRANQAGIRDRKKNIRAIQKRFDTLLRTLNRNGLWIVARIQHVNPNDGGDEKITFIVVPDTAPRCEMSGMIGAYEVMLLLPVGEEHGVEDDV